MSAEHGISSSLAGQQAVATSSVYMPVSILCGPFSHLSLILQILFLNKADLFRDKIMNSDRHLRLYFSQYTGLTIRLMYHPLPTLSMLVE